MKTIYNDVAILTAAALIAFVSAGTLEAQNRRTGGGNGTTSNQQSQTRSQNSSANSSSSSSSSQQDRRSSGNKSASNSNNSGPQRGTANNSNASSGGDRRQVSTTSASRGYSGSQNNGTGTTSYRRGGAANTSATRTNDDNGGLVAPPSTKNNNQNRNPGFSGSNDRFGSRTGSVKNEGSRTDRSRGLNRQDPGARNGSNTSNYNNYSSRQDNGYDNWYNYGNNDGGRPMQYGNGLPPTRSEWGNPFMPDRRDPRPPYRGGDHFFGFSIHSLPYGYRRTRFGNDWYYYNDGIFYRNHGSYYTICRPPFGISFTTALMSLSLTAVQIDYYYSPEERYDYALQVANWYHGRYSSYNVFDNDYYSQSIADDDIQYYYDDGVFYVYSRGRYYVVQPPVGALVASLPYDYYMITLNGLPFYKVDDALYQDIVIGNALYFEVVCDL